MKKKNFFTTKQQRYNRQLILKLFSLMKTVLFVCTSNAAQLRSMLIFEHSSCDIFDMWVFVKALPS